MLIGVYDSLARILRQRLERGVLSFLIITFQRDGSLVLDKDFSGLLKWQEARRRFTSQRDKENTYNCKCCKWKKRKVTSL